MQRRITCLLAVVDRRRHLHTRAQPELVEVNRFGQVRSTMYEGEQLALRAELRVRRARLEAIAKHERLRSGPHIR